MELVAPIALAPRQLRSGSCGAGTVRRSPVCACTLGGLSHPPAHRRPEAAPAAGHSPGRSIPGLRSPTAGAQPGTSPGHQLRVPGTPVPAVPGSGPGLAPGGRWQCRWQPPLMSSRLFPSLLCTRHAPCEPFLRGIRTKGSWEYLSGTGESGDAAGGTLLPSPRASPPWHRCGHCRHGHGRCGHCRHGYRCRGVADMGIPTVASLPWYCHRGHCRRGCCHDGHHCHDITAVGIAAIGMAVTGIAVVGISAMVLLQWHHCHGYCHRGHC